jgi:pyrroloquinoline quinone biosynthesis protein B
MVKRILTVAVAFILLMASCQSPRPGQHNHTTSGIRLVVLGVMQDAGSPQAGCRLGCCCDPSGKLLPRKKVVSLGVCDYTNKRKYLIEATPDFVSQIHDMASESGSKADMPDGIFISHAHTGHYSGLMNLGRESMGAHAVPVYTLPRLNEFIRHNGPWSQLVELNNIQLKELLPDQTVKLSNELSITSFTVPHRDEYSETAGFLVSGPKARLLFIPDIDKWQSWKADIREMIRNCDYALLDGTFYDASELPGRNLSEIPHPFVSESFNLFKSLPERDRKKIYFIHFNHTNRLSWKNGEEKALLERMKFHVATDRLSFDL